MKQTLFFRYMSLVSQFAVYIPFGFFARISLEVKEKPNEI